MARTVSYASHGAYVRYSRNVVCEEAMQLNAELFAHAYDGPLRWLVYDHSAVTDFHITTDDIVRTADQHKKFVRGRPPYVVAVVAPASFIYGLGRMWRVLVEQAGIKCTVIEKAEDAKAWLAQQGVLEDF